MTSVPSLAHMAGLKVKTAEPWVGNTEVSCTCTTGQQFRLTRVRSEVGDSLIPPFSSNITHPLLWSPVCVSRLLGVQSLCSIIQLLLNGFCLVPQCSLGPGCSTTPSPPIVVKRVTPLVPRPLHRASVGGQTVSTDAFHSVRVTAKDLRVSESRASSWEWDLWVPGAVLSSGQYKHGVQS